jgi:hypothetical protein
MGIDAGLFAFELPAVLANLHILAPALRSYFEVYNLPAFNAAFDRGIEGRPELEIRRPFFWPGRQEQDFAAVALDQHFLQA